MMRSNTRVTADKPERGPSCVEYPYHYLSLSSDTCPRLFTNDDGQHIVVKNFKSASLYSPTSVIAVNYGSACRKARAAQVQLAKINSTAQFPLRSPRSGHSSRRLWMAIHRGPIVASQLHEDSQGPESPPEGSPEDLRAFYEDMERTEILERKLSKRNSHSGASIWSRKSIKRTTLTPAIHPTEPDLPRVPSGSNLQQDASESYGVTSPNSFAGHSDLPRLATSRSFIGTSRGSPAEDEDGAWSGVPLPALKVKYPLHNPLGPRWYKNHHLIPPSQKKPSMRPPTFFSASFPPMHTSSSPEHVDESAESTNATSRSPVPTPTSSQTRVGEGAKPRSRKTSQTTPDTVDLLDLTDPWGTNWHHQSPYDIGQTTTVAEPPEAPNRTRRASMTAAQNRGKSVAPSPLSQSTSAVHLQSVAPEIRIPRKLSKRQTPTAANVFNPPPEEAHRKHASAPSTPVERAYVAPIPTSIPSGPTTLPKRMSVAPAPPYSSMQPTPKKEKRGSMLNRLAKKFSLLRKLTDDHETGSSDWWNHIDKHEAKGYNYGNSYEPQTDKGRSSPEKPRAGSAKRVPPPSAEPPVPVEPPPEPPAPEPATKDADRISLSSFDTPYSMGKLTIANPDIPDSNDTSIGDLLPPVPPDKPRDNASVFSRQDDSSLPPVADDTSQQGSNDVRAHLDKPLPPPQLATPQFSLLGLSELQTELQTPKAVEEPLPPTPLVTDDARPTPSPSPRPEPPEKTKATSVLSQDAPSEAHQVSDPVFPDRERTVSPPPMDVPVPRKASPVKDVLKSAEITQTRHETQSPPAHAESVKRRASRAQNSSPKSPEASTSKKHTLDKAANTHTSRESKDRSGETSGSSRHTRELATNSRSESIPKPTPVGVPFPTSNNLAPPDTRGKRKASQPDAMEFEGSPMSTSSMLANPPTPYDNRLSIALSDQSLPPTLPPKSIYEVRMPSNPPTTSPSRQTETFKLVRSLSGHVYASSETITAAGQQWEVVESVESKPRKDKSFSKSKEPDYRSRDRDREYKSSKDHDKSREYERSLKDYENRGRDDRKSRDYEHKSREYDLKMKDDRKSRDYESKVKDDRKSRDYEYRSKDYEQRSRDYGAPPPIDKDFDPKFKEDRRHKDYERKSRDYEPKPRDEPRPKDYEHRPKESDQRRKDHERKPDDYDRTLRDYEQRPKETDHRSKYDDRRYTNYNSSSKDNGRKSKEYESSGRREKESKAKVEPDGSENRRSSHKTSKQPVTYQEEPSKARTNGKSSSYQPEQRSRYEEPKSSRKKDEPKAEKKPTVDPSSSSRHHHATTSVQYIYAPAEVPNPEPAPRRLERNPSLTVRPTSELPSAAEMNAIRAKESWEMERLWKARSMYGLEPNGQVTNFIPESGSSSSRSEDVNTHSAIYGSSHTAYVVQSPFQTSNLGSQIYHSMPTGPPPIIYSSPASIPSIPDTFSSYEPYDNVYRSYATANTADYTSPPPMPRPSLNNPLPEPPRESTIDLTSLKAAAKPNSRHPNNDYWTKYNGITTAH